MAERDIGFLIDAQLPPALARAIAGVGYKARHVVDVGLLHAGDRPIWDFACDQGCALITKDEDFVAIRLRATEGVTVVWLRIRNASTPTLLAWFMPKLPEIVAFIQADEPLIELR